MATIANNIINSYVIDSNKGNIAESSSSLTTSYVRHNLANDYVQNGVTLGKGLKWSCLLRETLFNDDKLYHNFQHRELDNSDGRKICLRLYRCFSDQNDYDYILNSLKKAQDTWKMELFLRRFLIK